MLPSEIMALFFGFRYNVKYKGNQEIIVTQNAEHQGVRPYVPPEIVEGDIRSMVGWLAVLGLTTL